MGQLICVRDAARAMGVTRAAIYLAWKEGRISGGYAEIPGTTRRILLVDPVTARMRNATRKETKK